MRGRAATAVQHGPTGVAPVAEQRGVFRAVPRLRQTDAGVRAGECGGLALEPAGTLEQEKKEAVDKPVRWPLAFSGCHGYLANEKGGKCWLHLPPRGPAARR